MGRRPDRSNGIAGRPVDDSPGGVHTEYRVVMLVGRPPEYTEKALPIEPLHLRRPDRRQQGRYDIDILHHGIRHAPGLDLPRPAHHQGHMESHVITGPLAAGELGTLLTRVDEDGILLPAAFLNSGHALAKLPVKISDLGVILHHGLAGLRSVHEPGR